MISQIEALEKLRSERDQMATQLSKLQAQLTQGNEQYLKVQGAIEVLEQLTQQQEEETPEEE